MDLLQLLQMNLTFFSADGGAGGGDGGTGNPDPAGTNPGGSEPPAGGTGEPDKTPPEDKTFTQEDVNNIATKEARKAQEKIFSELGIEDFENAKEGFKAFQQWQEDQKTESEKQAGKIDSLEKSNLSKDETIRSYEAQLSAMKAGVNAESVEDVVALAEKYVSDDVTIDEAIKQVTEKYPNFLGESQQKEDGKPSFSTGQHSRGGQSGDSDPFTAKLAKYK